MTPQRQTPRWQQVLIAIGKAAVYLALFLGWQTLVGAGYSAAIMMRLMSEGGIHWMESQLYQALMGSLSQISLVSGLLTLATLLVVFLVRRRAPLGEVWIRPAPGAVLAWGAGLAFCLYWLVSLVLTYLPQNWTSGYAEASDSLGDASFLAFLSTALVGPVVEEVIFRGLIYTRLQRAMDARWAVVVSAAVFGACHGEFIWFCYAFVLGLIFAQLTRCTGSILPAMVMHVVFNATNQLLLLVSQAQVNVVLFLVILLLATGGTAVCAIQVRAAVGRMPRPAAGPDLPQAPAQRPAGPDRGEGRPHPRQGAAWDDDSGPDHRFPPSRM